MMQAAILPFVVWMLTTPVTTESDWKTDPIWHDGLVEKVVYSASREVYGEPREYKAIFFTNKEQHDRKTLTKANRSSDTVEVWKHNQIEVIPTPNYDYKYVTTSHVTADREMWLTRLDCSSQEFCGASFKQFMLRLWPGPTRGALDYWSFSYMPETGRAIGSPTAVEGTVAEDSLALWLRNYDFDRKQTIRIDLLPSQKSNRPTPHEPVRAQVRYVAEDDTSHHLEVLSEGQSIGSYWMAKDRLHVMVRYESGDGAQRYQLESIDRVNYWTIRDQ